MHRRDFLKACAAAGALSATGIGQLAFAAPAAGPLPLLVLVFQRGGCDGLNLVAPANEPAYIDARPPELRLLDGGERPGLILANGLPGPTGPAGPGLDFRLHPEAAGLHALYDAGHMAVIHACGLPSATRSHFEAQDLIDRGMGKGEGPQRVESGWLTRYLETRSTPPEALPAIAANGGLPLSLHGRSDALALPSLNEGLALPGGKETGAILEQMYRSGSSPIHKAGATTLERLALIDKRLPRNPDGRIAPYPGPTDKPYDNNGLTQGLQAIGRLARMELGLQVATVDHGGWDTHEGQPGRFANQTRELSRALASFCEDMSRAAIPVRVVVLTEFGRRLRANRSQGTDHGHGSVMLALGDGINGGRMYGRWPGLDTPALDQGVDLAASTDPRSVLAEALQLRPEERNKVFPDLAPNPSLGLVNGSPQPPSTSTAGARHT